MAATLGKSTANFPLGEAKAIASYKSGMVDDKGKPLDPPHPKSGEGLIFLGLMALVDPPREPCRARSPSARRRASR